MRRGARCRRFPEQVRGLNRRWRLKYHYRRLSTASAEHLRLTYRWIYHRQSLRLQNRRRHQQRSGSIKHHSSGATRCCFRRLSRSRETSSHLNGASANPLQPSCRSPGRTDGLALRFSNLTCWATAPASAASANLEHWPQIRHNQRKVSRPFSATVPKLLGAGAQTAASFV